MGKLKTLYDNIRYLSRYNLKEMNRIIQELPQKTHFAIDHIKYEINEDLKCMKKINILGNLETINILSETNNSIARFGDGE